MSPHESSRQASGIPLPALVTQLRRRCEADSRLQAGSTSYHEELAIFREFAETNKWLLSEAPAELSCTPDDEGNEHQVWFQPESLSFLKATWPNHFGMLVVHRHDEEPQASPIDYLERWHLHNEIFGDSVEFIGALNTPTGMRLLIRQPAIQGKPATDKQIGRFFSESGWKRFQIDGDIAYFDPVRSLVVSDTHRGNIIFMEDGILAPIDLRVQALSDTLLDIVQQLTK